MRQSREWTQPIGKVWRVGVGLDMRELHIGIVVSPMMKWVQLNLVFVYLWVEG